MLTKEFDVATFLDHLVFDWLQKNYFPDLVFSTQDQASLRRALFSGMALPAVCLYRSSPPYIDDDKYGRSVMPRTVEYLGTLATVQLMDYTVKYSFAVASYLLEPVNQVYQRVITLDKERYFEFDLSAILPPNGRTKAEFRKTSQDIKPELAEDQAARKIYISVDWELRMTIPCLDSPAFLDQVDLFINGTKLVTIGG